MLGECAFSYDIMAPQGKDFQTQISLPRALCGLPWKVVRGHSGNLPFPPAPCLAYTKGWDRQGLMAEKKEATWVAQQSIPGNDRPDGIQLHEHIF